MRGKTRDLKGEKFSRLLVIKNTGKRDQGHVIWKCRCTCGNLTEVRGTNLTSGRTKSCSCLYSEIITEKMTGNKNPNYKHGGCREYNRKPPYAIWDGMKQRCENPNSVPYKWYGKRGIKVCSEWADKETGFISFRGWALAHGYKPGLSIDRINNDGNYKPSNCQWLTRSENKRKGSK